MVTSREIRLKSRPVGVPAQENFELGSVPLLAQWYTNHLESLIRRSPGQYWWLHRRWKGQPGVRKKRNVAKVREAA